MTSLRPLLAITLISSALALTACGGGSESDSTYTTTSGDSTATTAQKANGKVLWTANCQACHGSGLAEAKNAKNIMSAIASNKGGMGILSGKVTAADADDIARYLNFGL